MNPSVATGCSCHFKAICFLTHSESSEGLHISPLTSTGSRIQRPPISAAVTGQDWFVRSFSGAVCIVPSLILCSCVKDGVSAWPSSFSPFAGLLSGWQHWLQGSSPSLDSTNVGRAWDHSLRWSRPHFIQRLGRVGSSGWLKGDKAEKGDLAFHWLFQEAS